MKCDEYIKVYVPKTLDAAKRLFEKFKQLNVERLNKEYFFYLFQQGNGELGFCIRNNTWQVCDPNCNLFYTTVVEM